MILVVHEDGASLEPCQPSVEVVGLGEIEPRPMGLPRVHDIATGHNVFSAERVPDLVREAFSVDDGPHCPPATALIPLRPAQSLIPDAIEEHRLGLVPPYDRHGPVGVVDHDDVVPNDHFRIVQRLGLLIGQRLGNEHREGLARTSSQEQGREQGTSHDGSVPPRSPLYSRRCKGGRPYSARRCA